MSCYEPIYAIRTDRLTINGKPEIKILGPLKVVRPDPKIVPLEDHELLLPCGKCIGCRMDYSRRWADRMMLELDHSKKAIFVTLTYNNDHVPFTEISYDGELTEFGALTLQKRDVQLFFKRLRKKFPNTNLRYFCAGEYGTHGSPPRPHYHAIIFGIGLDDLHQKQIVKINKLKQPIYQCKEINEAWSIYDFISDSYDPIGFASVGEVSWETCAYVARYVQKKVYSSSFPLEVFDCEPEFSLMSRRPGIGCYFVYDHPDVFDYSVLHVGNCNKDIPLPRNFLNYLVNENFPCFDSSKYDIINQARKKFAKDNMLRKLYKSDLGLCEQLENEENEKLKRVSLLRRDLD